jgi:hypothetical protein
VKHIIACLVLVLLPLVAGAGDVPLKRLHWSLEVKGGRFTPDLPGWKDYYGDETTGHYALALGYKVLPQVEAGIGIGYLLDKGKGLAPGHGTVAGNVQYEQAPLDLHLVVRLMFRDDQLFVPYAGGGWTRLYYRSRIENQATVRGSADGSHARAGLQLLLDELDPSASGNLLSDFGIYHSYLFIEARSLKVHATAVDGTTVDLGGTSWLGGLLFEF